MNGEQRLANKRDRDQESRSRDQERHKKILGLFEIPKAARNLIGTWAREKRGNGGSEDTATR